ncbi:MAG: hypothetical protein MI922_09195 [Bacteroidales bacterium]|nr:hypothetical protein [Bacteroidales bacterium]
MNRKLVIPVVLFLLIGVSNRTDAQYLIGKHAKDIISIMKTDPEYRYLKLNTTDKNKSFKYLKYEDRINQITVLFFLDDDNNCKMIRMMYDYSNINDVLEKMNKELEKVDDKRYEYKIDGKTLTLDLQEDEWFFTVTVREKK